MTVTEPNAATFSVSATGTAPLSYQWQRNGSNLGGATGSSYTLNPTSTADSGATFRVIVTNSAGSATSNAATLTVNSGAVAPSIIIHPASLTVTAPNPATFSASWTGTTPLTFRWQRNGSDLPGGSGSGGVSSTYTINPTSTADSGATIRVIVTNSAGSVTSNAATLTVNAGAVAPSITSHPSNVSVTAPNAATFSVTATGSSLSYQWQRNGSNIGGATSSSYTLNPTSTADSGAIFRVIVSNAGGQVTSNPATLTVNPASSGEWQPCGSGQCLTGGTVGIGTPSPDSSVDLHVGGDIRVDGNIAAKYQDIAEWVPASEVILPGTVVVLDPDYINHVLPSAEAYDTRVAGVVTAMPGIILGEAGDDKVKVATTGRLLVKVDASYGSIKIGDLLVTSDTEGVAMVSKTLDLGGVPIHRPGTIIGKALEPLTEGQGEILILLSLQ